MIENHELEVMANLTADSIVAGTPLKLAIKSIIEDAYNQGVAEGKETAQDVVNFINEYEDGKYHHYIDMLHLLGRDDGYVKKLLTAWSPLYSLVREVSEKFNLAWQKK